MTIRASAVIKSCTVRRHGYVVIYQVSATDGLIDKDSTGTVVIPFEVSHDRANAMIRESVAAAVRNRWGWAMKANDIFFPGALHEKALGFLVAPERLDRMDRLDLSADQA